MPIAWIALALTVGTVPASAHPFHITVLEGDINREAGTLEMSLRVDPRALVIDLTTREERPIVLAPDDEADVLIAYWLADVIEVRTAAGERPSLRYLGRKLEADGLWLFLEVDLPNGASGASLANRAFLALEPHQLNQVKVHDGDELVLSRLFTRKAADLAPIR